MRSHRNEEWPLHISHCCDCGIGCDTIDEYYMVHDEVWEQAWAGRRKPHHALVGQEILCIGCLENRIGRTLFRADFTDCPVNDLRDPKWSHRSKRLVDRLTADQGAIVGKDCILEWMVGTLIEKLPPEKTRRMGGLPEGQQP
jgi:hypothetical protein